jgi:hypothetical protein
LLAATDPLAQIIRYEELVRHPREIVRRALRFCELPASSRTEAYANTIISTQENKDDRGASSMYLPDELASAIDETWARFGSTE